MLRALRNILMSPFRLTMLLAWLALPGTLFAVELPGAEPGYGTSAAASTRSLPLRILHAHLIAESWRESLKRELARFERAVESQRKESEVVEYRLAEVRSTKNRFAQNAPVLRPGYPGGSALISGRAFSAVSSSSGVALLAPASVRTARRHATLSRHSRVRPQPAGSSLHYYSIRNGYIPARATIHSHRVAPAVRKPPVFRKAHPRTANFTRPYFLEQPT